MFLIQLRILSLLYCTVLYCTSESFSSDGILVVECRLSMSTDVLPHVLGKTQSDLIEDQSVNQDNVCGTAPTTPGLSII